MNTLVADLLLNDRGFVFDPASGETYQLNTTGLSFVRQLQQGLVEEEVLQRLLENYEVDENTARRDLAGFMEAPEMGPPNMASNNTVEPIASPANMPCSFEPCATFIITNIKKNVSKISKTKLCITTPEGIVAPNKIFSGNRNFNIKDASNAPPI